MVLAEIAREAGVSLATVSRVINQPHIVSPEKVARVRAVIERFNYTPLPVEKRRGPKARLATPRRVGVWFVGTRTPNPALDWFREQLADIQASDVRYRLDLRLIASLTTTELPVRLAAERLDGLIIQGMEPHPDVLRQFSSMPHVWFMTRRSIDYPGDYIEPNNEENGAMAADYLHGRGHRVVAILATDPDYSAIHLRQTAFVARARELGLTVHTLLGAPTQTSYLRITPPGGECTTLARRLLNLFPRATGLYFPAEHCSPAILRALREAGRRPGQDFDAILGGYNPVIYRQLDHAPAAIDINLPILVRKVVNHLLWRIEHPDSNGRVGVSISPRLIPARTSAVA